jgi:hypothetical protein
MGIGAGLFLLALGAILVFAVNATVSGLDLHVIGWVLMATGAAGLAVFVYIWNRRRAPATIEPARVARPVAGEQQVRPGQVYARSYDDPRLPPAP